MEKNVGNNLLQVFLGKMTTITTRISILKVKQNMDPTLMQLTAQLETYINN